MIVKQEKATIIDTETWLTPENQILMIQYAQLYWTGCYNQACQIHRHKDYYPLPDKSSYQCKEKKLSWKECTHNDCKGHIKPKI